MVQDLIGQVDVLAYSRFIWMARRIRAEKKFEVKKTLSSFQAMFISNGLLVVYCLITYYCLFLNYEISTLVFYPHKSRSGQTLHKQTVWFFTGKTPRGKSAATVLSFCLSALAIVQVNMEDKVEVFIKETAQITCMYTSDEGSGGMVIKWFYVSLVIRNTHRFICVLYLTCVFNSDR